MGKINILMCLILFVSCKPTINTEISSAKIAVNQVKEYVGFLTADELKGRSTGTKGIESAALFIESVFTKNKIKPYFETYRDSFNAKNLDGYNIVGFIEGNDPELKDEFVIIGAHYDHIGFSKVVGNDSIANGANDNASGTSAVLSLAKYLAKENTNKRSILVTLFSAEEMGLKGSEHLAKKLKKQNIDLYTMLNFEMIGVPFKDRAYDVFITGYELSNMSAKINEYTNSNFTGLSEVSQKYNLFTHSDNYPFYLEFKLPCQTISSCDLSNYDYYHHVDDEADKLDYKHMTSLIEKMIPVIEKICNSPLKEIKLNNE